MILYKNLTKFLNTSEQNPETILYSKDGKKSFLFKRFHRDIGEKDTHSYKISVEKIPYQ